MINQSLYIIIVLVVNFLAINAFAQSEEQLNVVVDEQERVTAHTEAKVIPAETELSEEELVKKITRYQKLYRKVEREWNYSRENKTKDRNEVKKRFEQVKLRLAEAESQLEELQSRAEEEAAKAEQKAEKPLEKQTTQKEEEAEQHPK